MRPRYINSGNGNTGNGSYGQPNPTDPGGREANGSTDRHFRDPEPNGTAHRRTITGVARDSSLVCPSHFLGDFSSATHLVEAGTSR